MKRLLLLLTVVIACGSLWAQGPNNSGTYYKAADGKKGKALKTALANVIVNPTNVGYDGLYEGYKKTDTRSDGYVRDWYSNTTNYRHGIDNRGNYSKEGDMYNREHSVPQSWFGSGGIKSDIVHVLPTDGYVNNRRSNYPFGEVNNVTYKSNNGYSKLGSCKTAGYSGTVFEPNDEIKGDMARIYFYMITRYEGQCGSWGHDVFTSTYPGLATWTLDMMMRWSKQDPVDEREIARNNAVYEVQGNRNPYVDYPGLEEYTWGSKMDVAFSYDNYGVAGGGGEVNTVAMPVFSPDAGTYYNSVVVTIACQTEGAVVYYTTNGEDASEQSIRYEGPVTLTATATIKAVAVKDGKRSEQSVATYTIMTQGGGGEQPVESTILLSNALFGTTYNGSISASVTDDLAGTQNGVTVVYSLGGGSNRYCNDSQIRLYPGNTLTVSVEQGQISELQFSFADDTPNTSLKVGGSSLTDGTWTGSSQSVTVEFGGTSKHARLTGVTVKSVAGAVTPDGIDHVVKPLNGQRVIYNLWGQRVMNPTKGLYIVDGKKVMIP